ncbi:MAG: putative metal-binding motif-containing protein [Deltaproteobacteria bacterium]|nr:putative metal-binding motif-containing protein [Deltaproteobacteria bacterium]
MPRRITGLVFAASVASAAACGARTTLDEGQPRPDTGVDTYVPPECTRTEDCAGFEDKCAPVGCSGGKCVALPKVTCDDGNSCTDDACEPASGKCTATPKTLDLDGDGHRAPLPGKRPGEPGACGDDCDDTSGKAFPGNKEVCDGVDNDCNGVVDDAMMYVPQDPTVDAVRVSELGEAPAGPAGLAWSGESYLAGYTATISGKTRLKGAFLDPNGKKIAEARITNNTIDALEGRVVWTGAFFGTAWSDRRDGSWEIYFNRLNAKGEKLGPDLKVSEDPTWSINLSLAWTGKEFALAWQDQRELDPDFGIWGARVDVDGKPVGGNVKLADGQGGSPELAVGLGTIALAWTVTVGKQHRVWAAVFDRDFNRVVEPFEITGKSVSGVFPVITWNKDRYVVAFYDPDSTKKAVWGFAFDEKGNTLVALTQLTESPRFSRYPSLLPLGDRALLVWSDTKDGGGGYELYTKMLDPNLKPMGTEQRITRAVGDSIFPVSTFGPTGDIGVLFRDDRLGSLQTFFTRLVCKAK